MTPAAADVVHLLVAAALTYALGFERDLRGAAAGDRVFALIGVGAGIAGVLAVHGAPTALQGALTAIGFIGAGIRARTRQARADRSPDSRQRPVTSAQDAHPTRKPTPGLPLGRNCG